MITSAVKNVKLHGRKVSIACFVNTPKLGDFSAVRAGSCKYCKTKSKSDQTTNNLMKNSPRKTLKRPDWKIYDVRDTTRDFCVPSFPSRSSKGNNMWYNSESTLKIAILKSIETSRRCSSALFSETFLSVLQSINLMKVSNELKWIAVAVAVEATGRNPLLLRLRRALNVFVERPTYTLFESNQETFNDLLGKRKNEDIAVCLMFMHRFT